MRWITLEQHSGMSQFHLAKVRPQQLEMAPVERPEKMVGGRMRLLIHRALLSSIEAGALSCLSATERPSKSAAAGDGGIITLTRRR
jgi:hypothetical protein